MGKIAHSPFLYHLFMCCGGDYKTFVIDISDQIENKIEEIYIAVQDNVMSRKIGESNRRATTKEFRQFVERMEKCKEKEGKTPKYCMFGFYKQIAKLEQYLMSSGNHHNALQSDIDIMQRFRSVFDYYVEHDAEAINDKRLRDLLENIRDGKTLSNIQEDIFNFILNESFPKYSDERGGLLERISSKPWEEVAFGDFTHCKIIINAIQNDERYEQIKELFNNFDNKILTSDVFNIKKNLIKISRLLDEMYKFENYFDNKANYDEKKNNLTEYGSVEDGRVLQLHSHILAFMRWIPMMSQDEPDDKMMESVDNVIDQIKTQVCKIVASNDSLRKVLERYPVECHDTIFTQSEGVELRKLLVDAMYHESEIHLQFQRFYGVDIPKRN